MKVFLRKIQSYIFWRLPVGELITNIYHIMMHLKYSFKEVGERKLDRRQEEYYLTKQYHIIEKGLALPSPRIGFGQEKIIDLSGRATCYVEKYGENYLTASIRQVLISYLRFHEDRKAVLPSEFARQVESFIVLSENANGGGVRVLRKNDESRMGLEKYDLFLSSRAAVRQFSHESIDENLILESIRVAGKTPSVCNRQGWAVHYYSDDNKIREILHFQNGNAGFADQISRLIIVTGRIGAFTRFESNQLFIDGGLFSMNILNAIHAAGLGACPLNTCYPYFKEEHVKKVASIPQCERLIMMIGIGSLREEYQVAFSRKCPVENILTTH